MKAAQWTFQACQFDDGAVGMCGRDDKWLGFTGDAVTQVAQLRPHVAKKGDAWPELYRKAEHAHLYLCEKLETVELQTHGVQWVHRKSSTNPLVNVAMLWASALLGWLNGQTLFSTARSR